MTKTFKIGDIVEANEASNGKYGFTTQERGWRGKVSNVYGDNFDAHTIAGRGSDGGEIYEALNSKYFDLVSAVPEKQSIEIIEGLTVELTPEQLEEVSRKLQEAKKAPEPTLKEGDWIRIKDYKGRTDISDEPYKIVEIDEDGDGIFYDDAYDRRNTCGKDFEIVELTPFDRAGREHNEFEKGDIVRVLYSPHGLPVGTIFEVESVSGYYVNDNAGFTYKTDITDNPRLELVTPVESRVDRVEGGERA